MPDFSLRETYTNSCTHAFSSPLISDRAPRCDAMRQGRRRTNKRRKSARRRKEMASGGGRGSFENSHRLSGVARLAFPTPLFPFASSISSRTLPSPFFPSLLSRPPLAHRSHRRAPSRRGSYPLRSAHPPTLRGLSPRFTRASANLFRRLGDGGGRNRSTLYSSRIDRQPRTDMEALYFPSSHLRVALSEALLSIKRALL